MLTSVEASATGSLEVLAKSYSIRLQASPLPACAGHPGSAVGGDKMRRTASERVSLSLALVVPLAQLSGQRLCPSLTKHA